LGGAWLLKTGSDIIAAERLGRENVMENPKNKLAMWGNLVFIAGVKPGSLYAKEPRHAYGPTSPWIGKNRA
jgi:hypothetical protein